VIQKRADAVVERRVLVDRLGGRTRAELRLDRGGGVLSLRDRRAGGVCSDGGADHREWESEQGDEPETPEQRGAQVLAFGSAVAEPEQPAVDRVRRSASCSQRAYVSGSLAMPARQADLVADQP
jgi:hypothetical protein